VCVCVCVCGCVCVCVCVQDPVELLELLLVPPRFRNYDLALESNEKQHRRVHRVFSGNQGGIAHRCAAMVETAIARVNEVHGLTLCPLTLGALLKHTQAGRELLEEQRATPVWQKAVSALTGVVGRGTKEAVVGVLVRAASQSGISTKEASKVTGQTQRYCLKAAKAAEEDKLGALANLSKTSSRTLHQLCPSRAALDGVCVGKDCKLLHECQCCRARDGARHDHAASECPSWTLAKCTKINATRKTASIQVRKNCTPSSERIATREWFEFENPARSGDQQSICWMVKGFTDFYEEEFRTAAAQVTIIQRALAIYGDDLRDAATTRKNVWFRNVDNYLKAERTSTIAKLHVLDARPSGNALDDIKLALEQPQETFGHTDPCTDPDLQAAPNAPCAAGDVPEAKHEDAADDDLETPDMPEADDDDPYLLTPRSADFFYKRLLNDMRLWRRPPHNHCDRCAQYTIAKSTVRDLTHALLVDPDDAEYPIMAEMVERAGGSVKAWETVRNMGHKIPVLQKHMDWQADQRPYSIWRDKNLSWNEVMLYLDYGGFTDSANKKVSVWSATAIAKGREQEHFDFFFNQGGKGKDKGDTAKKNGKTGIAILGELFDPAKSPEQDGISMFRRSYPDGDTIVLSGDTGNGYRAYEMLEELSTFFAKYGLKVTLMPLPPGHAWNRTDARIAHQNTFLEKLKAISRLHGAKEIAAAFRAASDPKYIDTRKYMQRSHCFFRRVHHDEPAEAKTNKRLGEQLFSENVDKGHIGVRGLLYFNFSVIAPNGVDIIHPQGYARVREFANPDRPNNPTHVYTWRKDLAAKMCQRCSDAHGGPVALSVNSCSKKKCGVVAANKRADEAAAKARVLPQQPLDREHRAVPEAGKAPAEQANAAAVPGKAGAEADKAAAPARKRGRPKNNASSEGNKQPAKQQRRPAPAQEKRTQVFRQVRVVHGVDEGKERAQVWMYVPCEPTRTQSRKPRRGFWLDKTDQEHGLFALRPAAAIQNNDGPKITDITVFNRIPFTRLVKLDKRSHKELHNTIRFITERPFTMDELITAKNGEDVAGPLEEIAAGHHDPDDESNSGDGDDSNTDNDDGNHMDDHEDTGNDEAVGADAPDDDDDTDDADHASNGSDDTSEYSDGAAAALVPLREVAARRSKRCANGRNSAPGGQ
jgi:hypothetical protein